MALFGIWDTKPLLAERKKPTKGDVATATKGLRGAFSSFRVLTKIKIKYLTLAMMLTVSIAPTLLFYKWIEKTSIEKEIAYVDENHLIIAKNLSATLSRYVSDMKVIFNLANKDSNWYGNDFQAALTKFNLSNISILDSNNTLVRTIEGAQGHAKDLPSADVMPYLRRIADEANGEITISGIRNHIGSPHFFVVQNLPTGQLAVSPWDPAYVIKLQKSIAFGERGHSMVVDADGLVVAHPNAEWQAISKNASKLSVVQAMITGNTGVMQFYSPPMKADMIAGYTFIPETGWGVMVPQPLSELEERADQAATAALILAAAIVLMSGMISWWFSSLLARPIHAMVISAREISKGNLEARVDRLPRYSPFEIKLLAKTFNTMVDDLCSKKAGLRQALEQAEELSSERAELLVAATKANKAKSQFVSMVSHELRTPLTCIKGALDLLKIGVFDELDQKSERLIDIAGKNSERLAAMINDLLDFDKLDTGMMNYKFGDVDLSELIEESVETNKVYGNLNAVTFRTHSTDEPIFVKVDHSRIIQVLANLLSNAAKFSNPDSVVDIDVEVLETTARVHVKDYGVGIPQSAREKIFEPFVQLDSSDRRIVSGSGLGLNIAKQIVERHGGTLDFSSEEGNGTDFYFDVPLTKPDTSK
jgi:signal transduction histidine kinase